MRYSMGMTNKIGIDYFPFNVDFFEDDKLQLVQAEFGSKGLLIMVKLLCKIYKNGYYYQWGEDECLLFTKNAGAEFVPSAVNEVVMGLVRRCLFDKRCFDSFHILTSSGIQQRYFNATKRYKSVPLIKEYLLLNDVNRENVVINSIVVNTNKINVCTNPHTETDNETEKENPLPPSGDERFPFQEFWDLYGKKNDRIKCEAKWKRLKESEKQQAMKILPVYVRSTPNQQFRKNPLTWINGKCWNDESLREAAEKKSFVQSLPDVIV